MQRVTPEEAVRLGYQLTVGETNAARSLYKGILQLFQIKENCDFFWLIAMIFNAGRIEGIRAEREAKRTASIKMKKGD